MTPMEWMMGDDTGTSSQAICAVMTGTKLTGAFAGDVPHDNDDFGRCYRLLKHFPEWRARMGEMGKSLPKWGPMVGAWDELTALYEQCCEPGGRYTHQSYESNKETAKKLYERMSELEDAGYLAAGWISTGKGCWRRPNGASSMYL